MSSKEDGGPCPVKSQLCSIESQGQASAHSGFSGGGSGGSIYITTYHFDGSGQVQVDGNINLYDE